MKHVNGTLETLALPFEVQGESTVAYSDLFRMPLQWARYLRMAGSPPDRQMDVRYALDSFLALALAVLLCEPSATQFTDVYARDPTSRRLAR